MTDTITTMCEVCEHRAGDQHATCPDGCGRPCQCQCHAWAAGEIRERLGTVTFTDSDGNVWTDVVICAEHGIISTDLGMMHCPRPLCGRVLGERSASPAEIRQATRRPDTTAARAIYALFNSSARTDDEQAEIERSTWRS